MTHEDNHVIRITPDDESVEFEMNDELGRQEQREINRRVKWAREQREAERIRRESWKRRNAGDTGYGDDYAPAGRMDT